MPWKVEDVVKQRIEFVVRAVRKDESVAELCRQYGISRETGYQWLRRFRREATFSALVDRSRRPEKSPNGTSAEVVDRVVRLRRQTGWGGRKLQDVLAKEEGLEIQARTIDRIIQREGLIQPDERQRKATKRFEKKQPNQLWQMDFKGQYRTAEGHCYPLSILDDHSRYLVALHAVKRPDLRSVEERLKDTVREYGLPEAMLMDHGTPWWGSSNEYGLTQLSVQLIQQGVRLIYSGIGHPQTQGKVERFHRTLKRSLRYRGIPTQFRDWQPALDGFRDEYNNRRPHEALTMARPADRYQRSARIWREHPEEWPYPAGSPLRRINDQGALFIGGRYRHVARALAGQRVRLEQVEDKVLVIYRHMVVREIDVTTGQTKTFIYPLEETTLDAN